MSAIDLKFASCDESMMTTPEEGLRRQVMSYTAGMMLVRHTMAKGWVGVKHSHPHEQMVYLTRGHIVFETPDGKVELKAGDSLIVPGGVEHQASALEDTEALDIFTPHREDYASA